MKIILFILLFSPYIMAQDRLQNFIDEAVSQNPLLKAGENRYLAKEFLAREKSVLPDPVLGFTQWVDPVETRLGPQQNIFSLAQKIPFPGKLSLSEEIVLAEADQDKLHYQAAIKDLTFNVKSNWYNLYLADQSLLVLEDYYLLLKDFADAAAAKYATGQGIQAQVLKAQLEHSAIQARIYELQRQRLSVQTKLNQLRNMPAETNINPVLQLDSAITKLSDEELYQNYYDQRPEFQASLKAIQQAELQRELAQKNWYPDLTIQANYITVEDKNSMALDAGKDAWGVMFAVNLPLWFSGRNAQIEKSSHNVLMQQAQKNNIKSQIESEIADYQFQEKSSRETISLYKDILIPQAESSLKSSLAAYRSGSIGFLDMLDAERMLLQLRLTFIKELVNHKKIIAGFERAIGGKI